MSRSTRTLATTLLAALAPLALSGAVLAQADAWVDADTVRARTGHDFSDYKKSTVRRRIQRRMAIHQIDTVDNYVNHLRENPVEAELLRLANTFLPRGSATLKRQRAFRRAVSRWLDKSSADPTGSRLALPADVVAVARGGKVWAGRWQGRRSGLVGG